MGWLGPRRGKRWDFLNPAQAILLGQIIGLDNLFTLNRSNGVARLKVIREINYQ
jgi:hypothetical protein